MQILEITCGQEINEGKLVAAANDFGQSKSSIHLYEVGIITPVFEVTEFILAENEESACSQAECIWHLSSYSVPDDVLPYIHSHATRKLFGIQGWSRLKF